MNDIHLFVKSQDILQISLNSINGDLILIGVLAIQLNNDLFVMCGEGRDQICMDSL